MRGMEKLLCFGTIRTHLYTNMDMGAVVVDTVHEQLP